MRSEPDHDQGTKLSSLVKTLRSKNAGVDMVTFDVFFNSPESYHRVLESGVLSSDSIAELYGLDLAEIVTYLPLENLLALKFTIRRSRPSGSPGDSDIFGAQQYAPLLDLIVY